MRAYKAKFFSVMLLFILIFTFMLSGSAFTEEEPKYNKNAPLKDKIKQDPKESERFVSIDFNNVDINVFIKFISELTGKNFVVDNRVRGKVTIISPDKISVEEAYKVFESVLDVHDFACVDSGKVIKIVPAMYARTKNIETRLKEEAFSPDDRMVTQIISLKYASPSEIKRLFSPLISKSSVILDYQPTNMLLITDVYSNIQRLLKILKKIDITGIGQQLSLIPVETADASKLVSIIDNVFRSSKKPQDTNLDSEIKLVADERTNSIVVLASEDNTNKIKNLMKMLDKETPHGHENIHIYYCENATAEDLSKALREVPSKTDASDKGKAPVISDKVKITADKATNSLIIVADQVDYSALIDIIKKLDIPRAMVYLECLIMEVNIDKGFNLGTEWQAMGKTDIGTKSGGIGGGFAGGGDAGFSNMRSMMPVPNAGGSSLGTFPNGFSLGLLGETIQIGNIIFPSVGAIVNAYRKDKDVNILSTPQILATDNQEATITVGKNIPYLTKSGTTTTSESYNSFEYKDVGISLKITPQISKDRLIRLKIAQEVTKLDQLLTTSGGDSQPTTLKRTINTAVIVYDKNTVVIGGLIDDSFSKTQDHVPCLGNVPGFGWLFKSVSQSNEKTNLFVFITPHVIRNPKDASDLYGKKQNEIGKGKIDGGKIKMYDKPGIKTSQSIE